jgi:hypothetical protein
VSTEPVSHCPECDAQLKRCSRCGLTLPADQFTKSKTAASGLSSWCRGCQKAHRDDPQRKARTAEFNRDYRNAHPRRRRTLAARLAELERQLADRGASDSMTMP